MLRWLEPVDQSVTIMCPFLATKTHPWPFSHVHIPILFPIVIAKDLATIQKHLKRQWSPATVPTVP